MTQSNEQLLALIEKRTGAIHSAEAERTRYILELRKRGVALRPIAEAAGTAHETIRKLAGEA